MNVKLILPSAGKWDMRFQLSFNTQIEQALAHLNPSAQAPGGGAVGAALVKLSARNFDTAWGPVLLQGSGAPGGSAPQGALYINLTASTPTTRLYVYTGSAWASFTASA